MNRRQIGDDLKKLNEHIRQSLFIELKKRWIMFLTDKFKIKTVDDRI